MKRGKPPKIGRPNHREPMIHGFEGWRNPKAQRTADEKIRPRNPPTKHGARVIDIPKLAESIRRAQSIWQNLGKEQKKALLESFFADVEIYYGRVIGRPSDSYSYVKHTLDQQKLPSNERLNDLFTLIQRAWSYALERDQQSRRR